MCTHVSSVSGHIPHYIPLLLYQTSLEDIPQYIETINLTLQVMYLTPATDYQQQAMKSQLYVMYGCMCS